MTRMHKCMIIGEVGQSHDGSLGMAHAFIDAIAAAGANAVKFQTHIAEAESTPYEPWRIEFSQQDPTRHSYWKRMEFSEEQWLGLKRHAEERGLLFLSSAFSVEAVDLLSRVGVAAWKVASGEVNNTELFDRMVAASIPFIISTGMSTLEEIDRAVRQVNEYNLPYTVLQCTSVYPCPPEKLGLNMIPLFQKRYGSAGLSDHSGKIYPGLAAAAMGIDVLEVHVAFSREMFGPDVPASVTTKELNQLVEGVRFIERALGNPVDKDHMAVELAPMRSLFTKSIVAKRDLLAHAEIREQDLDHKKPGTGIPSTQLPTLIGRKLKRDIKKDEQIRTEDLYD